MLLQGIRAQVLQAQWRFGLEVFSYSIKVMIYAF
jgi:hypothetical protein